ncbi:MAG: hypothetical protein LLG37_07435 [Spirochaetia bacterium]|nr:hypothetical protein [Spirochaetia bacterium]
MDTQEFCEYVKNWLEFYHDVRMPDREYAPAEDHAGIRWEDNMIKIAGALSTAEHLHGTPAEKNVAKIIELAGLKDRSKLNEIYKLMSEIGDYLGDGFSR